MASAHPLSELGVAIVGEMDSVTGQQIFLPGRLDESVQVIACRPKALRYRGGNVTQSSTPSREDLATEPQGLVEAIARRPIQPDGERNRR